MYRFTSLLAVLILGIGCVFAGNGQAGAITPGDSLVTEGIPAIPGSLAQAVNRYTNAYGFRLAGWDTSKREVLIKNLAGSETWIMRAANPNTRGGLEIWIPVGVYDVYYQPQAKYLIYDKDADGNDQFQFYLYDTGSHKSTLITDGVKSRNTEPVWSNAGDRIIYSSSPYGGNGVDLSIMSPIEDRKNTRVVAEGKGNYLKAYDWSPDDRKALYCNFASNTTSTLWMIDVATAQKVNLSQQNGMEDDYYDNPQ